VKTHKFLAEENVVCAKCQLRRCVVIFSHCAPYVDG